jgi:hypothetical protein
MIEWFAQLAYAGNVTKCPLKTEVERNAEIAAAVAIAMVELAEGATVH